MSELSSLYCKVKITKPQLEKFLNSPLEEPQLNKNWLDFWESRKMYSRSKLTQESLYIYHHENNQNVIDGWLKYKDGVVFSDYDETSEEWHWGMIFFSENYNEMLPMFAFIISLEKYVSESTENRAIVFPFFWGDNDVQAYIHFENGNAILSPKVQTLEDVDSNFVEQTKAFLSKKWEEFSKNIEWD